MLTLTIYLRLHPSGHRRTAFATCQTAIYHLHQTQTQHRSTAVPRQHHRLLLLLYSTSTIRRTARAPYCRPDHHRHLAVVVDPCLPCRTLPLLPPHALHRCRCTAAAPAPPPHGRRRPGQTVRPGQTPYIVGPDRQRPDARLPSAAQRLAPSACTHPYTRTIIICCPGQARRQGLRARHHPSP